MADCIVRVISDCFRTSYCYAQQGCAQRDTAPLTPPTDEKKMGTIWIFVYCYIVVQCRLYTPAKYFVSNSWNSKNMPLLQIPTKQFSTTIRELNWNKVIIFACCWRDSWVDRPRDRNYKICKFKNTYTQDNKQLFQIIGQIHGAMLLNIDLFTLLCCY